MQNKNIHHFLIFFVFICLPQLVWTQTQSKKAALQTTKIGFIQSNYSGTTNKSFALGGPGYAFEMSTDSGGTFLRYFLKGRISYSEGKQNFLNTDKTTFMSSYKYSGFSPEFGISLFPVSRRDSGMNMYLWGIGIVSYNYLDLATIPADSSIRSKDQGYGTGYGGGLGFEFIIPPRRGGGRYVVYGEVGFRDEKAQLVQTNEFEISGMTFCLGLGF